MITLRDQLGIVSLDFDDGYKSAYDLAVPLLDKAGLKGTFYLISRSLGQPGYMSAKEALSLYQDGHAIAGHTRHHPHLTELLPEAAEDEILGCRQDLGAMNLGGVAAFAYPYGDYNESIKTLVQEAGFAAGRTIDEGLNDASADPFTLRAVMLYNVTPLENIFKYIDDAKKNNHWLILVFHRFNEGDNPISVADGSLQKIIDYIQTSGLTVATVPKVMAAQP